MSGKRRKNRRRRRGGKQLYITFYAHVQSPFSHLRTSWLRCQRRDASLGLWIGTGVISWVQQCRTAMLDYTFTMM